jgi:hypothetical protein
MERSVRPEEEQREEVDALQSIFQVCEIIFFFFLLFFLLSLDDVVSNGTLNELE